MGFSTKCKYCGSRMRPTYGSTPRLTCPVWICTNNGCRKLGMSEAVLLAHYSVPDSGFTHQIDMDKHANILLREDVEVQKGYYEDLARGCE